LRSRATQFPGARHGLGLLAGYDEVAFPRFHVILLPPRELRDGVARRPAEAGIVSALAKLEREGERRIGLPFPRRGGLDLGPEAHIHHHGLGGGAERLADLAMLVARRQAFEVHGEKEAIAGADANGGAAAEAGLFLQLVLKRGIDFG